MGTGPGTPVIAIRKPPSGELPRRNDSLLD
jgi:hypothetical protein